MTDIRRLESRLCDPAISLTARASLEACIFDVQIIEDCKAKCLSIRGRLAADVLSVRTEQVLRPEELVGAFPTKSTVGLMV